MTPCRERELAADVASSKRALFDLLTPGERRTKPRRGSAHPITVEDTCRVIARDTADPRAPQVGARLADYQRSINVFWEAVIADDMVEALSRTWIKLRRSSAPLSEIRSEVTWTIRRVITSFDPSRGASFFTYAFQAVTWDLDLWSRRRGLPFEISEGSSADRVHVQSINEDLAQ